MSARSTVRSLPTLMRVGFAEAVAYRAEMLVWVLSTTMPLIMLGLWSAVAADAPVGRFNQRGFVAYFLATFIVRQLTGAWVAWQMSFEVRTGTLAMRLLRPLHPMVSYAVENIAAMPLRLVVALPEPLWRWFFWARKRCPTAPGYGRCGWPRSWAVGSSPFWPTSSSAASRFGREAASR